MENKNQNYKESMGDDNLNGDHDELTEVPHNDDSDTTQPEKLAEELNESNEKNWEEKYHELYDTYLRLFSEFDNFRKRSIKERSDLIRTAGSDVMQSLLPVLDDFDRAKRSMEESTDIVALKQGIDLIYHKFKHVLQDKGLTVFNPSGELFDAELHEALTNIPAPTEEDKGKIQEVIEMGYKIGDKIIRYPKVVVYS